MNLQVGDYGNALQAAIAGSHEEAVAILLDAGARTDTPGGTLVKFGNALPAAAYKGSPKFTRRILDAGADVNAQGDEHGNALQAACFGSTVPHW